MRRSVIVLVLATLAVAGATSPAGAAEGSNTPMPSAEQDFFGLINAERADAGRAALKWHTQATSVARAHSNDMADDGELRHNPNLAGQMSNWRALGENVGQGPSVDAIHTAFMNSPSHRSNILDAAYTHVGIGVVERDGSIWVTEVFVTPSSSSTSSDDSSSDSGSGTQASPKPKPSSSTWMRSVPAPTASPIRVRAASGALRPVVARRSAGESGVGAGTMSVLERLLDDDAVVVADPGCWHSLC